MLRIVPVILLASIALPAAQRPADDNAFPRTKSNGRATVEYKDDKVQAVAIYDYSQRNHDTAWILVQIGVALSDPSRTIASPFTTLPRRRGKRPPIAELISIMDEQDVDQIVVGLPLSLSGDDTEWTRTVREFSATLATRSGRPVTLIDERFSSRQAERTVRSLGLRKTEREQKERVDAAAAAVILEAYMNTRSVRTAGDLHAAREGDSDAVQE